MAVSFVNNAGLLSGAFDRVARQYDPQVAALQQLPGAIAGTSDIIRKEYTAGQVAKALGEDGSDYNAAAQRAMALGDEATALKYADLYDKSLDRQAQTAYRNAMLAAQLQKNKADADKDAAETAAKAAAALKAQESLNRGLEDLDAIARSGDLTTWGYRRAKGGFASETHRNAEGKLKAAIAAIAPAAIQRLKEAGVSGINTEGEFYNYIGLPPNPTSDQLAGALPRLKATLGYTGDWGQSPVPGAAPAAGGLSLPQSKYTGLM